MLSSVTIDNIALIRHTEIDFTDGFNVLSGETGAGKSILIGSMNMLLGERISRDLIRNGEKKAMVQALFYVNEPEICAFLSENRIEQEDDGALIVSRELSQDGKNVCKINGQMVTVSKLRELGRLTMNVHGQHDNQALLDKTTHLGFLDSFADSELSGVLNEYKETYKKLCELSKELDDLCVDEAEKLRLVEYYQLIEKLREKGTKIVPVADGDVFNFGETQILVVNPVRTEAPAVDMNENSVALKITYKENSALLCADVSDKSEKRLAEQYGDKMKCDLLKVAHHGIITDFHFF
jgi:DNA repair protein RecN (Recombination protein N)